MLPVQEDARGATDIEQLWREYKATGSRTLRNALMEAYLPLVKYSGLPRSCPMRWTSTT